MKEEYLSDDGIKRRVVSGVMALSVRRVSFQIIITLANIALARILTPEIFGSFAIIYFLINTLGIITSWGLGASVIQKSERIQKEDLRAIFTFLLLTSCMFVVVFYFLAPAFSSIYLGNLGNSGIFWTRLFSLQIVLLNVNTISASLLEKKLDYKKVAFGEIFQLLTMQLITIFFAIRGLGVGSFVLGQLLSRVLTIFLYFILSPWPIGLSFAFKHMKRYMHFGINYQLNSILNAVNSAVIPGFVGAVAGPGAVGYLNWAGGVRQAGMAPFEVIEKLVFPACSRAQNNTLLLRLLIEKMIKFSCMLVFPLLAALFSLGLQITTLVYTSKWLGGMTALYLSLLQGVFVVLGTIMIDILFALGKAKNARNITFFWAILQWVLAVPLVLMWNFNGAALAGLLVAMTFVVPLIYVKKYVIFSFWVNVLPYLFYSALTGVYLFSMTKIINIDSIWQLIAVGLSGAVIYFSIIMLIHKKEIIRDFYSIKKIIFIN